jgi:competence protein ComEA
MALVLCAGPALANAGQAPAAQEAPGDLVDLNGATAVQLETLPGVGERTAERIIEYREENGGFKKIEELMNVRGIGERSFLRLRPLVTLSPAKSDAGERR